MLKDFEKHQFRAKGSSGKVHLALKLGSLMPEGWKFGTACGCLIPPDSEQPAGTPVTCEDCLKELSPGQLRDLYAADTAHTYGLRTACKVSATSAETIMRTTKEQDACETAGVILRTCRTALSQ